MYIPSANAEERPEVLAAFMREHPFASLVSVGPAGEIQATHLPVVYDAARGEYGIIEGHIARANPHYELVRRAAEEASAGTAPHESLVIFTGPEAYVTPSWYPGKAEHGRVVPTWNYIAVHAYGTLRLREDASWLMEHLTRLTNQSEADRSEPWAVADAPADYIAPQLKAIVGFELQISRIEGRWKMSQNRSSEDIDGVVEGLGASERPMDRQVGVIVEERRPPRP